MSGLELLRAHSADPMEDGFEQELERLWAGLVCLEHIRSGWMESFQAISHPLLSFLPQTSIAVCCGATAAASASVAGTPFHGGSRRVHY